MADNKKDRRGGDDDDSYARTLKRPLFAHPRRFKASDIKPDSEILTILLKNLEDAQTQTQTQTLSSKSGYWGGELVGRLIFTELGTRVDCSTMTGIPPFVRLISDISSDGALFILLVGNRSVFTILAVKRFYERFPCIMITASTRGNNDFFQMMKTKLNYLPVLALLDCDPRGVKILSLYGRGSRNIHWLGIRPTDLEKHNIPQDACMLPMTQTDIKAGKKLLEDDFVNQNPGWRQELDIMMESKQKVEIEALCYFGFDYLTGVFLPMKLQEKDWI